jgi:hypothetical protein
MKRLQLTVCAIESNHGALTNLFGAMEASPWPVETHPDSGKSQPNVIINHCSPLSLCLWLKGWLINEGTMFKPMTFSYL